MIQYPQPSLKSLSGSPVTKPFQVLITKPLHGDRCSISRAFFDVASKDLGTGSLPPDFALRAQTERERERDHPFPEPSVTCHSKSPINEAPSSGSLMGPLWREVSVTRAFFYVFSRVPSRGGLPSGSPRRAPIERERKKSFEKNKTKRHINTRTTQL